VQSARNSIQEYQSSVIATVKMKLYLDNAATTQVDKEVIKIMGDFMANKFGNPSSLHSFGREAKEAIELARSRIAKFINVKSEEIIFTSGGSESNNLAIQGLAKANPDKKHIITSKIEHPSILEPLKVLEKQGYKIDYISVDEEGIIDLEELKSKIIKNTLLVSIMHVNNEIGTIQPIEEIAALCKGKCFFHTDAVQSFCKIQIDASSIDLLSASGHKINASKGIGILYIKQGVKIKPIINGGSQERDFRSGTENVPGIVGLAKAVELAEKKDYNKIKDSRDKLVKEILKIKGTRLNGSSSKRIFNNINISFQGIEGESLLMKLDKLGIAASTGSACSSHSLKPSHVLLAIGLKDFDAHGSLRLTLGNPLTDKEINYVVESLNKSVKELREISPFK